MVEMPVAMAEALGSAAVDKASSVGGSAYAASTRRLSTTIATKLSCTNKRSHQSKRWRSARLSASTGCVTVCWKCLNVPRSVRCQKRHAKYTGTWMYAVSTSVAKLW